MMTNKSILALSAACVLAACGGNGGTPEVLAGDGVITEADYIGKTVPLRYFGIRLEGGANSLLRSTGSIKFIDADNVQVSLEGQTYTLTYDEFLMIYTDGSAEFESSPASPSLFTGTGVDFGGDVEWIYAGGAGFQTALADVPTSSLFAYVGVDEAALVVSNGTDFDLLEGSASLLIDFDDGSVIGQVFDDADVVLSIENGAVSWNGITGNLSATLGGFAEPVANTQVDGWFYGNTAESLLGTYEGEFTDLGYDFVGGFVGTKTDPL